jgi:hypothetical protein
MAVSEDGLLPEEWKFMMRTSGQELVCLIGNTADLACPDTSSLSFI